MSCRSPFLDDAKIYAPLANLYLKASINEKLPDVRVMLGDTHYDLDNLDNFEPYDAVGISIMTPQRKEADQLARAITERFPDKIVIAGGPHAKHYGESLEANSDFNYIVQGDGEIDLINILQGRAPRVQNTKMSKGELIAQPRPDRTSRDAKTLLADYGYMLGDRKATTMMTGRGCPELCTFCEDAATSIRWTGLEGLVGEMNDIVDLGYKGVYIFDDLFAISQKKITPIVRELANRDLAFRANAQARYFTRDGDEMARFLADHGCVELAFGAESGSQKILDNIQKRCTVEQNFQTVEYAKKHGIKIKAFMLIGLPGETRETLEQTEAFIRDSEMDDFQMAIYMPFKGTAIRDALDRGESQGIQMITGEDNEISGAYGIKGGQSPAEVSTDALSQQDLQEFRDYLVKKYRPTAHDKFFEQGNA